MAGFFFPLVIVTACFAWAEALSARLPSSAWVARGAGLIWGVSFAVGALGGMGGGAVEQRLAWMDRASVGAASAAGLALLGMVVCTVVAFTRPAPDATP